MAHWTIDVLGEQLDLSEIQRIAPACDCAVDVDQDHRYWLRSSQLENYSEPREVQEAADKLIRLLNGIARLSHSDHHPVVIGSAAIRVDDSGRRHISLLVESEAIRVRMGTPKIVITDSDGTIISESKDDSAIEARKIANDPQLRKIVEILSSELNWQKLRLAFEGICNLAGDENALKKLRYFTDAELRRFKANCHDPRISGDEALHIDPWKGIPEDKMSLQDGHQFLAKILRSYLADQQASP